MNKDFSVFYRMPQWRFWARLYKVTDKYFAVEFLNSGVLYNNPGNHRIPRGAVKMRFR